VRLERMTTNPAELAGFRFLLLSLEPACRKGWTGL
jgi:hypothetical protein